MKTKTLSLTLALLLIFAIFPLSASAASYAPGVYVVNVAAGSRIRSKADQNSSLVGNIQKGTRFKVTEIKGDWGYTPHIKTSNGYKSGWSYLPHSKYEGIIHAYLFASTKGKDYSYNEAYDKRNTSFKQGTKVYVWGAIVNDNNKPTGANACTLKLSVYNPSGKCVYSYQYDNTDNNWIGYKFDTVGTWKIKAEFSGWIKCAGTKEITITEITPTSVTLNRSNTTVTYSAGKTTKLTATVYPTNATNKSVTWSTSNSQVATVSGGTVTLKAPGVATITAKTINGKTASCKVTVKGIAIKNKNNYGKLYVKDIDYIYTKSEGVSNELKWKSADSGVLSVNSKGKITAKKAGKATITVTTKDGYSDSVTITVLNRTTKSQKQDISYKGYTTIRLNKNRDAGYFKIKTWWNTGVVGNVDLGTDSKIHVLLRDNKGKYICEFDATTNEKLKLGNDHSEYRVYISLPAYPDNPVGNTESFLREFNKWQIECTSYCHLV